MSAFWASILIVALAELGDKTQLLVFALASRFRKPWSVVAGVLVATIANHLLAAVAGSYLAGFLSPRTLAVIVGISFLAFAAWALKSGDEQAEPPGDRFGPLLTTALLFFLAEMGDKTQLTAAALAAKYGQPLMVVAGTSCGMMLVSLPAVWLGGRLSRVIAPRVIRFVSAGVFLVFGIITIAAALFNS
jgi:Ca2+/H+ antiporter, TMEM165/GDT1 family